jgi:hypothetical protein
MKTKITFIAALIFLLFISNHLHSQEKNKLNKSELREKVVEHERDIDSLSQIITVQSSDISNKMSQINSLKNEIQTKDSEINTLKQTNKSNTFQLNKYKNSIDSLRNALSELKIQLEANQNTQQSNLSDNNRIKASLNLKIPEIEEEIEPIGWSKDGKFAYRQIICDEVCGCCSSDWVIFDAINNKIIKSIPVALDPNSETSSIAFDNQLKQIQLIINTYRILPVYWGEYIYYAKQNEQNLHMGIGEITENSDATSTYISNNTNQRQIEYPFDVIKDEIAINAKLILTIQDDSYKITQDKAEGLLIESGILNRGDPMIPTFDDNVGIAGYFVSPWNVNHKAFVLANLSSGFENYTQVNITLFSLKP